MVKKNYDSMTAYVTPFSFVKFSLGLLASASFILMSGCGEQAPSKGSAAGMGHQAPQVAVISAEPTRVPDLFTISGRAEASTIAEIRPQVEGIIVKRNFEEGSHVKKGEVMYELDPVSYQALYDNAKAAIAKSDALVENAKLKVKRNQSLVKINAVSEQVLDDARVALREAKANLEANKAALKTAQINLERTKIRSPITGMVGRSELTKGALVTANQATSLATVQQLDPIYVDFSVPSYNAIKLKQEIEKEGEDSLEKFPVTIFFEDGRKYPFTGKIKLSEFKVNRTTDSIILRTEFKNPTSLLLPGMFIRGKLMTGYKENVFLVPAIAVGRNPVGKPYVMVVDDKNTAAIRPVKDAGFYEDKFIITGGLNAGDKIITQGLQYVRPGVPVSIKGEASAAKPATSSSKQEEHSDATASSNEKGA